MEEVQINAFKPVAGLGVPGRHVDGGLLVAHQDIGQVRVLDQGLPDPRHVAVAEDAQYAREEGVLLAIALDVLILEKSDDCLGDCHPLCFHRGALSSVLVC